MDVSEHTSLRIIDANLNRAREALRVMEEYARFGLDDAPLCGAIKQARHDLAAMIPASLAAALPHHRGIAQDVGRMVGTESEYHRACAADVARAACKRLSEALRAIEEYGKTLDEGLGRGAEALRYRAYELEQRLALTVRARERFGGARLYVLITAALCRGDWYATAEAALRGGADVLQLREKELPARELTARAARLAKLCRGHGALCIVNDRADIALAAGADGVHLGQDDLTVADARRILPASSIVGVSTHSIEQVAAAATECPDYIAVGPMFESATKPQGLTPGPALLAAARKQTSIPLVAIGGIDADRAGEVVAAGACCLCVCQAIIGAEAVEEAARALRRAADTRG